MPTSDVAALVARLREAFDETFARPRDLADEPSTAYVLVRAAGRLHALATAGLRAIVKAPPIVRVPAREAAFIGIAASRGVMLGVYALAELLGQPPDEVERGWVLVCADGQTGLAVETVVGLVHARPESLRIDAGPRPRALVTGVLELEQGAWPVIDLPAVMQRIGSVPTIEKAQQ